MEHNIDEFHKNQDLPAAQASEESLLDAEVQEEYEDIDRYRQRWQEYEESEKKRNAETEAKERQQRHPHQQQIIEQKESEDEHSVFNQVKR